MAERAPGAAMRRRHRQLRVFHRHERLTVRMELATVLHHSAQPTGPVVEEPREVEAQDTYAAPRGQKLLPPGTRPEVLKDPEPQGRLARRELVCDALAPLLVSLHVVDDAHIDHSSLRFLLAQNLAAQKEQEDKEQKARRQVLLQEFSELFAVPVRSRSLLQVSRLEALAEEEEASTSSWCANPSLWARVPPSLFVVWCAVFPSFVDWPEMLGIIAVMDQHVLGFTGDPASRAVFLPIVQAYDAPHHGRYAPEGQLPEPYRKIGLSGRFLGFFYGRCI